LSPKCQQTEFDDSDSEGSLDVDRARDLMLRVREGSISSTEYFRMLKDSPKIGVLPKENSVKIEQQPKEVVLKSLKGSAFKCRGWPSPTRSNLWTSLERGSFARISEGRLYLEKPLLWFPTRTTISLARNLSLLVLLSTNVALDSGLALKSRRRTVERVSSFLGFYRARKKGIYLPLDFRISFFAESRSVRSSL